MNALLFNKPYRVLCQFTDKSSNSAEKRQTLADYIRIPKFYPAGRLDYDSEGLMLLTNEGKLQSRISDPKFKLEKRYWAQLESTPSNEDLAKLRRGIALKDGMTKPAKLLRIQEPTALWPRNPAVVDHRNEKSCWIDIAIHEGRNRQVRRMFAAIGTPVLRLVRHQIGEWSVGNIPIGEYQSIHIHLPQHSSLARSPKYPQPRTKNHHSSRNNSRRDARP